MGTFIVDGAAVLPPVKADARPASGATTEWAATDTNKVRTALLDLRTEAIAESTVRASTDASLQSQVTAEVTARGLGDQMLQAQINALPAHDVLGDASGAFVTAFGSTTPRQLQMKSVDVYNVKDFGAVGDGVTDDTPAIRAAIAAAGAAGGGTVFVPNGRYAVMPQEPRIHNNTPSWVQESCCFVVNYDNITIQGAGPYSTTMVQRGYGNVDLQTTWQFQPDGNVWRGSMFSVGGGHDYASRRKNFTLRDIGCDGGVNYTGNIVFPANPVTGDGWDYTHGCVAVQSDHYADGIRVFNCYIRRNQGENIGGGGLYFTNVEIVGNRFEDTNSNFISIQCSGRFARNHFYRAGAHFIENGYDTGNQILVHDNYGDGCGLNGVSMIPTLAMQSLEIKGTEGPIMIHNNLFKNVIGAGIVIYGGCNASLKSNVFVDCGAGATATAYGKNNPENVSISDNEGWIIATSVAAGGGASGINTLPVASGTFKVGRGNAARNNRVYVTRAGEALGLIGGVPGNQVNIGNAEPQESSGNMQANLSYGDNRARRCRNLLITGVGDTIVATQQPLNRDAGPQDYGTLISGVVTVRVITAPTDVRVWIRYQEPGQPVNTSAYLVGSAATPASLAVGVHHFSPLFITGTRYGNATCQLHVQVGTANQVYVNGLLRIEDN